MHVTHVGCGVCACECQSASSRHVVVVQRLWLCARLQAAQLVTWTCASVSQLEVQVGTCAGEVRGVL